jgi:hypothetical protein
MCSMMQLRCPGQMIEADVGLQRLTNVQPVNLPRAHSPRAWPLGLGVRMSVDAVASTGVNDADIDCLPGTMARGVSQTCSCLFDTVESSDALLAVWVGPKLRGLRERQSRVRDKGPRSNGIPTDHYNRRKRGSRRTCRRGLQRCVANSGQHGQRVIVVSTGNSSP